MKHQINKVNRGELYAIFAIIIILHSLIAFRANSQSISVGIGYTSSGDVPVSLDVTVGKIGGYITYIADAEDLTADYEGIWNNELTLGVSYQLTSHYPEVKVLTGFGWTKDIVWERELVFPNAIYSNEYYGHSFEAGFEIRPLKNCKFIYLKGLMSSYSGLKTMLVLRKHF
jgi:hypothetical protein